MKRTRHKPIARETKREPVTDIRAEVQDFVRFLRETGEASLETKFDLPERDLLQRRVQILGPCAESLIGIIEKSGIPEETREVALHNLWSVLMSAYIIGSEGTISENTKVAIKYLDAANMREAKVRHREPSDKRMQVTIAEAEKNCPPGRGHATAVVQQVISDMKKHYGVTVSDKTVTRRRKKMGTV